MSADNTRKTSANDAKQIIAEAARWHALIGDDAEVADNLEAFSQWLEADERHLAAFSALCTPRPAPIRHAITSVFSRLTRPFHPGMARWAVVALAVTVVAVSAAWPTSTLVVPPGLWQDTTQDDGSVLRFGPDSRADLSFTRERRLVSLTAGSVIVEAAKDPKRPLIVKTPHGAVRVVGTRFTVIVDPSSTELTVSRGEVRATAAANPGAGLSVLPAQRVHISTTSVSLDPLAATDPEEAYKGWRTLDRAPLADLTAAVERETGLSIIIVPTTTTRATSLSGRFHVSDAESTLSLLVNAYGLHRTDAPFDTVLLH